jgi:hypothetical protein
MCHEASRVSFEPLEQRKNLVRWKSDKLQFVDIRLSDDKQ